MCWESHSLYSEYHILLLNEPLIPRAQWRAPPECVSVCVRGRAWGGAGLYVFAGRWGYFSSLKLKQQWGQSQESGAVTMTMIVVNFFCFITLNILNKILFNVQKLQYLSRCWLQQPRIFREASQHRKSCRFTALRPVTSSMCRMHLGWYY